MSISDARKEAQKIVDILSFVVGDGLTLGRAYDPIAVDSDMQQRIDATTAIDDLVISISDAIYESTKDVLDANERTRRALTWYNIGLGTETPEDRFVAFWTGLEALITAEYLFTSDDPEHGLYRELQREADRILEDYPVFCQQIKTKMGEAKREPVRVSLARVLTSEADYEEEDLDGLSDMASARNDIVHRGERVEDADEKSQIAQRYLRDVLDNRLGDPYRSVLETDENSIDLDPDRTYHPVIHKDEWIEIVFNGEPGKELSKKEIQKRAFALLSDIHEVARIQPEKFSGWMEPLHATVDGKFKYAPMPDWVTSKVDAILRYLSGAGAVPAEVIAYNASKQRADVELDTDEAAEICGNLEQYHVVEQDGDYYAITIDGKNCVLGKLDPSILEDI